MREINWKKVKCDKQFYIIFLGLWAAIILLGYCCRPIFNFFIG